MRQKSLANWLKLIIVVVGVCGLLIYSIFVPSFAAGMRTQYPEFSDRFWPWLLFILSTAIPCGAALVFAWRIAVNIGKDRSFSMENARYLKWISWLAAGDSVYFLLGNFVLLFLSMSHPGIVIVSFLAFLIGIAVSGAIAAMSHLVQRAANLQEQSDLTI